VKRIKSGGYIPDAGESVAYRSDNGESIGRVLDYDTNNKGELVVLIIPGAEETRTTRKMLIIRKLDQISMTNKIADEIIVR